MSSNPLVSVVIPVYNVEQYIDECVESVIEQTYGNIEIILVDDAATDESGKKCDMWQKRDKRIKVVHKQKNEGLNMARMTGFDVSHGQYVTFLDSDDIFHQDNITDSLKALHENGADVVIYGLKEFSDQDAKSKRQAIDIKHEIKQLTTKNQIARYAFFGDGNLSGVQYMTVCGKLYARKVVDRVNWKVANYRSYEDNFWTPQAFLESNVVVLMAAPLLYYRRNLAYGVSGDNLGNHLIGNSLNGRKVGYLELLEQLKNFYYDLSRKYGFSAEFDKKIDGQIFLSKTWRIDNLVKSGLLMSENNLEFVLDILPKYIEAKNKHIENLSIEITHLNNSLTESNQNLAKVTNELTRLNKTFEEYLGIKRSAKLLAGNIKRKIIGYKG